MGNVSPFQAFKLQELFDDIKNASRQGVLTPAIAL
jgi:hypothetical protein